MSATGSVKTFTSAESETPSSVSTSSKSGKRKRYDESETDSSRGRNGTEEFIESSEKSVDSTMDSSIENDRISLPIEEKTSSWTDDTLHRLKISSNTSQQHSAKKILDLLPLNTRSYSMAAEKIVNKCIQLLDINSSPLARIDVDDVKDIDTSTAFSLMFFDPDHNTGLRKRQVGEWIPRHKKSQLSNYENWFCNMYYIHGQQFTQQLISMCVQQKSEQLQESAFVRLFEEFAGMFGLVSVKQSGTKIKIGNTQVNSIPDVIFPDFTRSNGEYITVLAICEVFNLDNSLLGQHGGELLCHLPLTDKGSILGIVLQRTMVTFSNLSCTDEQLDNILKGKPKDRLEIKYSRPYNFLRAEDREELIKALLTLGVIQITPFI